MMEQRKEEVSYLFIQHVVSVPGILLYIYLFVTAAVSYRVVLEVVSSC